MGTRRRLSKRQLKQDKFVSSTFELAQFVRENIRRVLVGVVVLAAAAGGIFYYVNYREHREERALQLMATARLAFDQKNYPLAISDLEKIDKGFPQTSVGSEAALLLADAHYRTGKYEEARGVLTKFMDRHGVKSPFSFQACMLLGKAQENLGAFEEAAHAFVRAEEGARFDYQRVDARMAAARAYTRAGKVEEAVESYRTVIDRYSDVPGAGQAEVLLAEAEAEAANGTQ